MKIISKGNGSQEPWVGKTVTCRDCGCKLELEVGDKIKYVSDQREGSYYSLCCPGCESSITIDASLFGRSNVS